MDALPGQTPDLAPSALPGQGPCLPGDPLSALVAPATDTSPLSKRRPHAAALPSIQTYRGSPRNEAFSGSGSPNVGSQQWASQSPLQGPGIPQPPQAPVHSPSLQPGALQGPPQALAFSQPAPTGGFNPVLSDSGTSRLRVHVITYNMAGNLPSMLPLAFFGDAGPEAEIFVIGTQESCAIGDWERLLCRSLGRAYVKKAQESLMSISLLVFAHTSVESRITAIRTSSIACGVGNVLGNKGAVGVSCVIDGARVLFITSHLAAHDQHTERRNADYQRIFSGLFSANATSGNLPVAAAPGGADSGASTPALSESPRYASMASYGSMGGGVSGGIGSMEYGNVSAAAGALGSSPGLVSRMSRLAHVSSMSQIVPPASPQTSARESGAATPSAPTTPHAAAGSPGGVGYSPSLQRFVSTPLTASPRRSVLPKHDIVVWAGDLNYRINGTSAAVRHLLSTDMVEVLHANDQLRLQMRKGKVFQGFHEQAIHFPPTFKFEVGSSAYSEKRIPSWTDRILHTCHAHENVCFLEPLYYRSINSLRDSDHRAVVAGYELTVSNQSSTHTKAHTPAAKSRACTVC